ncbi:hypothetical protein SAMN05216419_100489 [Nitrosomonas cryotolerans]|uniref:Peptidase S9 prolyl oligopeptidase catalytic domain-containing protein n=1 Tax=Nitrosomonas cryotolerans ATCC 49181 TaxID=1131553 RepID=A0A1N6JDP8_9PROT|nr:alpha/beta fold hydrolase [Nitrosomonas cryotolerans]SFP49744.1 hypothetical protein SAMN05216419_100489 [Nitrosomonas cryotolerans]SIO42488.1 hypothetical protein SAMN02743940_2529 [Nitrosomonas cryotolerans ATCC 49181]
MKTWISTHNKRLRCACMSIIYLFLAGFVVLNMLAYKHAYDMLFFSDQGEPTLGPEKLSLVQKMSALFMGVNIPRPTASFSPTVINDSCKQVAIPNGEASYLGAWHCQPDQSDRLVILFHGYVMDKSSLIEEAKVFLQAEYSVLLVDFRGSWESSESYTTIGYREADDVASAVSYAEQYYRPDKMILYGRSMGATAIFRAIYSFDIKVDAIIVEAIFDNLLNTIKNRFTIMGVPAFPGAHLLVFWGGLLAGFDGFSHNPAHYAVAVNCPILFFHGEQDTRVKLFEARQVYDLVPSAKIFSSFPDTGHESHLAHSPEKWKNEVMNFLNSHL